MVKKEKGKVTRGIYTGYWLDDLHFVESELFTSFCRGFGTLASKPVNAGVRLKLKLKNNAAK